MGETTSSVSQVDLNAEGQRSEAKTMPPPAVVPPRFDREQLLRKGATMTGVCEIEDGKAVFQLREYRVED